MMKSQLQFIKVKACVAMCDMISNIVLNKITFFIFPQK